MTAPTEIERPTIPGFEIGEPLGRGGMGNRFRAREVATARDVALKWLPARAGDVLRKRFEREARAAAAVRHAHIVPVLSAGSLEEGAYIVMELVDGFSLSEALHARALGRNALLDLCAKVARALACAHEGGVVHRDVKPDNIIVDAVGEPRLVDFGLARFLEAEGQLTGENTALGTVGYMAPEVVAGGGAEAGPPCDVFALGAILHEGLAGEPAFGAGDTASVLERLARHELAPLPAGTPSELATLAGEALDRDPAKRPTALAFAERLETLARSGAPPAPVETAARPRSRRVALVAVGLVGAVLGALGVSGALRARARRAEAAKAFSAAGLAVDVADPVPPARKPLTASELDASFDEATGALAREDRARATELARQALDRAPPGEERRTARFHGLLGREALMDLRTAEAQREYGTALELDASNVAALLGSCATALVEGDAPLAARRLKALEDKGPSGALTCARALAAAAKREAGFRAQLLVATGTKTDPALMKVVVAQLLGRDAERRR